MALSLHNSTVRKTINYNNKTIKFNVRNSERKRKKERGESGII